MKATDKIKLRAVDAALMLATCRATLNYLENSDQAGTLLVAEMAQVITLLQEAGANVHQLPEMIQELEHLETNPAIVEAKTSVPPDDEELIELKTRIAANEGKPGIPHEQVVQRMQERIANHKTLQNLLQSFGSGCNFSLNALS